MDFLVRLGFSVALLAVACHWTPVLGFSPIPPCSVPVRKPTTQFSGTSLHSTPPNGPIFIVLGDDDDEGEEGEEFEEDDDDHEELEEDPYTALAAEEFRANEADSSALATMDGDFATFEDWGGALGKLRQRVEDVESGRSREPSNALFRLMSAETPNQVIGNFVTSANPETVQAMSGAVSSLLGGLSSPAMGVETIVKASGDKIGSLCFQLQMTGYLFRNAEYVLALKDLLKLKGKASLEDYREAFDRLDTDGSGYIESSEVRELFNDVYEEEAPQVEIDAFLQFFDQNDDGKISWEEFEMGLGAATATQRDKGAAAASLLGVGMEEEDEDEDDIIDIDSEVSGTIQIELESGKVVEVDAKDYVESLKAEARTLKEALRKEKGEVPNSGEAGGILPDGMGRPVDRGMDVTSYIASRQGDVKALTEGISPEIVKTMKRLVDFVLEGGDSGGMTDEERAQMEMEIPGAALQQLALWQLVLGYRLREQEATGEYKRLLQ